MTLFLIHAGGGWDELLLLAAAIGLAVVFWRLVVTRNEGNRADSDDPDEL